MRVVVVNPKVLPILSSDQRRREFQEEFVAPFSFRRCCEIPEQSLARFQILACPEKFSTRSNAPDIDLMPRAPASDPACIVLPQGVMDLFSLWFWNGRAAD